jgi:hypothetical protein
LDRENTRVLAFEHQFLFYFFAVILKLHTIVARLDILESVQHFPVFALHLVNLPTFESDTALTDILNDLLSFL